MKVSNAITAPPTAPDATGERHRAAGWPRHSIMLFVDTDREQTRTPLGAHLRYASLGFGAMIVGLDDPGGEYS
jgi:hypothetical protein